MNIITLPDTGARTGFKTGAVRDASRRQGPAQLHPQDRAPQTFLPIRGRGSKIQASQLDEGHPPHPLCGLNQPAPVGLGGRRHLRGSPGSDPLECGLCGMDRRSHPEQSLARRIERSTLPPAWEPGQEDKETFGRKTKFFLRLFAPHVLREVEGMRRGLSILSGKLRQARNRQPRIR